jgi:hypothetical protein
VHVSNPYGQQQALQKRPSGWRLHDGCQLSEAPADFSCDSCDLPGITCDEYTCSHARLVSSFCKESPWQLAYADSVAHELRHTMQCTP